MAFQFCQRVSQGADLGVVAAEQPAALALLLIAVFSQIGQVQEITEGTRQGIGLVIGQGRQLLDHRIAFLLEAFSLEAYRSAAHSLNDVKNRLAFRFTNGGPQDSAQQADVLLHFISVCACVVHVISCSGWLKGWSQFHCRGFPERCIRFTETATFGFVADAPVR